MENLFVSGHIGHRLLFVDVYLTTFYSSLVFDDFQLFSTNLLLVAISCYKSKKKSRIPRLRDGTFMVSYLDYWFYPFLTIFIKTKTRKAVIAPLKLANTSKLSACLVLVKAPCKNSIKIPKQREVKTT